MRGPFDIADRMLQASSPSLKPASIISSPSANSPIHQAFAINDEIYGKRSNSSYQNSNDGGNNEYLNILDGRSGILLNKEREDLCWDCLFMVCGGTGITPMFQLVSYKSSLYFNIISINNIFYFILFYFIFF